MADLSSGQEGDDQSGSARYVFGVRVRLESNEPGLSVDPSTFETRLYREADPPGEDGWLFFRDNLWRGELGDERFMRDEAESTLGVTVESIDFRELRTDETYLAALKEAIAADVELFNADSVTEVLNKYLGSSIHVE
ncbi:MAG: LWR-salt protein [Halovenus sp.]